MSRFKEGQQIICIRKNGPWNNDEIGQHDYGPRKNEIVTVYDFDIENPGYLVLTEYRKKLHGRECSYREDHFEPLPDITEIHELLSAVPETKKV